MELIAKSKLEKLKRKNRGNTLLAEAIDAQIDTLDEATIHHPNELKKFALTLIWFILMAFIFLTFIYIEP